MLDKRTIQAMPTRQLLQTHASFVATVEQADVEIGEIRAEIEDRERKIAEVEARTASLRTLSEMTYAQLIQNGYDDASLDSSIAIVNQAIDNAIGSNGSDEHDAGHHADHDHRDAGRRGEPALRAPVREIEARPAYVEPRPAQIEDRGTRRERPVERPAERPVALAPPSIFHEIEGDGPRAQAPHPLRGATRQRSFEDLAEADAGTGGGFSMAPDAFTRP